MRVGGAAGLAAVTSNTWQYLPHLRVVNAVLQRVKSGEVERAIFDLPIRHGKSTLISGYFAADYKGSFPDRSVLMIGHTEEYSSEWGGFSRDLLEMYGPELYDVAVSRKSSAKKRWKLVGHEGGIWATSTGGSLPGKGGDLMIIDDPVKKPEHAFSPIFRKQQWDWYREIALGRVAPGGATLLVMSRWFKYDLAGMLMQQWDDLGLPYVRVHLPALAMQNDLLGRKPGEALAPEMGWTQPVLEERRKTTTFRVWMGQYQGEPTDEEGEFFKRTMFRYYGFNNGFFIVNEGGAAPRSVALSTCRIRQAVDLATSEADESTEPDWTVIITYAYSQVRGEAFLLNVTRKQIPKPELIPLLKDEQQRWLSTKIRIEKYGYQKSAVQDAVAAGLPAEPVDKGRQSKEDVAEFTSIKLQNGTIYFPRVAYWLTEFEAELLAFPAGKDDQVDALGYVALDLLSGAPEDHGVGGAYVPSR